MTKIEVLNPIKWTSVRRNEVGAVAGKKTNSIFIEEKRQQRNALMLRDVRYRIYAKLVFIPVGSRPDEAFAKHEPGNCENPKKYYEMFERRARNGQCFTQPYLGTRECTAYFRFVDVETENLVPALSAENGGNRDLGIMLFDMDFSNPDNIEAMFYRAEMKEGVIVVPSFNSEEILR